MERKKFKKRFKMNTRSILSFIMLFALCLSAVWNISWADCRAQEKIMDESHKSIKVKPSDLYAFGRFNGRRDRAYLFGKIKTNRCRWRVRRKL